ncbi:MAG: hypothetical protein IPJ84_05410 [Bdellovibrionales bacterium]|nr:hypothetical protein [Bdellovibrionales bacterium]
MTKLASCFTREKRAEVFDHFSRTEAKRREACVASADDAPDDAEYRREGEHESKQHVIGIGRRVIVDRFRDEER